MFAFICLTNLFVKGKINTNKKEGAEMNKTESIIDFMKKNNGLIKAKQAHEAGFDNKTLQRLSNSGQIERISHGIYLSPDYMEDEYALMQYRCSKGIFSHDTALYFHGLSDRVPLRLTMTIPSGFNTRLLKNKSKYKFFYVKKELQKLGKIAIETPFGHRVSVYDKERTLCDCIKKKEQLDKDIVFTAIKLYMKDENTDYLKLLKYASIFKVREQVRQYMEVLL